MSPPYDRLRSWWTDEPRDPARPLVMHPDVQRLLAQIAPGERVTELGGTMSLNLHLQPSHRVLRIHRPFVTAPRLLGEQALRRHVARSGEGLSTAEPISIHGRTILRCGTRLAEVEPYLDSIQPEASVASYRWLFLQLGRLHRSVLDADVVLPRSLAATWAPPGSLARWLKVTVPALSVTSEGSQAAHRLSVLTNKVRQMWIPPAALPAQVVHGDIRLGNLARFPTGLPVVFDFGFADRRPRVHDLAYSLAFMVLALGASHISPLTVADLIHHYSEGRGQELDQTERQALPGYAASVMLHAAAHDGFTASPLASLEHRAPFLDVADWLLDTAGDMMEVLGAPSFHRSSERFGD